MAYDAGIILQGQPVNVLGAMSAGNQLAAQTQELQRQNALSALYKSQGAGIMNGDPGALNALAQYDPNAALGIKQQQQGMAFDAEKMGVLREEAKNAAADRAKALTAEQRAAEAAKLEAGLKGAAFFYQKGDRQGYTNFIQQQGLDPNEFTFDSFPAHAAQIDGVLEAYKTFAPEKVDPTKGAPNGYIWNDPTDPRKGVSPIAGMQPEAKDDYQRYVQEEKAAGRQPLDRIGFENAKKGKGFSVTTADGTVVQYGGGGTAGGEVINYNPGEIQTVLDSIDSIANNPSLSKVVGPIQGGGGNDIDKLNMAQRVYYGGDGLALIEKIGQLQNTTWLAARQMLKGGGAITDYESKKAEGAMARLSRAKGEPEFRAALKDLTDAIVEGKKKLEAAQGGKPASEAQPATQPVQTPTGDVTLPPELQGVFDKYK